MVKTIEWSNGKVVMLDQTRLPIEVVYKECDNYLMVAEGIKKLWIRGAPAIGIAAAMGIALAAQEIEADNIEAFTRKLGPVMSTLLSTRPTAVNIKWAVDRFQAFIENHKDASVQALKVLLVQEAKKVLEEDILINRSIGAWGAQFIHDGDTILTHCNAGSLATGGYGTATARCLLQKNRAKNSAYLPMKQGLCCRAQDLLPGSCCRPALT